ncbi:4-amino-4-deoxy-L-arabinose transferase-like glycosyltransferase [Pedobacter sp. UYP30]|uniref:glycosyltransferase family 39 protein n=1 Tax=Pedobacter sp. UYP30 TaxID=1756400 RepID=UPI003393141B
MLFTFKDIFRSENKKEHFFLLVLVFLGIFFRLYQYFYNHSLWLDETYLSISLFKKSYYELAATSLLKQQKAPLGFLWLVKSFITLFGNSEYTLRLVSLISGIATLFIFIPVAKFFLNYWGILTAVGILALAPAFVHHSVEVKQYGTEMFCTVLLLYFYIKYRDRKRLMAKVAWGAFGAIILWFSYAAVFIAAGIAVGLSLELLIAKNWRLFFSNAVVFLVWMISFLLNYVFVIHAHAESPWTKYWFDAYHTFMPFPPKSISDLTWFPLTVYRMFDYPLGLLWNFMPNFSNKIVAVLIKMSLIPIAALLLGVYALIKGKREYLLIFSFSILLTFIASGLKLYPLVERFWVFIAPIFLIIIGLSVDFIARRVKFRFLAIAFAMLLIFSPLVQSAIYVVQPTEFFLHKRSFHREAFNYINTHFKPGDVVYVYWNDLAALHVYEIMDNYKFKAIEGIDVRNSSKNYEDYYRNLSPDFRKLANKRVWVMVNTYFVSDIGDLVDEPTWYYRDSKTPPEHLIEQFSKMGKRLAAFQSADVDVFLFDLRK